MRIEGEWQKSERDNAISSDTYSDKGYNQNRPEHLLLNISKDQD
jgi:hypothetical protein